MNLLIRTKEKKCEKEKREVNLKKERRKKENKGIRVKFRTKFNLLFEDKIKYSTSFYKIPRFERKGKDSVGLLISFKTILTKEQQKNIIKHIKELFPMLRFEGFSIYFSFVENKKINSARNLYLSYFRR